MIKHLKGRTKREIWLTEVKKDFYELVDSTDFVIFTAVIFSYIIIFFFIL